MAVTEQNQFTYFGEREQKLRHDYTIGTLDIRACLNQLLIAIRSLTLLCDHSQSKTRLIAIINLTAKLEITDATACHASLCTTMLYCLPVSCRCRRTALSTMYKPQQQLALWVCVKCCAGCQPATNCWQKHWLPFLPSSSSTRQSYTSYCCTLAYRQPPSSTGRPTDCDRSSTLVSHCQHIGLLRWCL